MKKKKISEVEIQPEPTAEEPQQAEPEKKTYQSQQRLKYTFLDEEIFEKGKKMAFISSELSDLMEEKKAVASDFKAKIEAKQAAISLLGNQINNGYEYRVVNCITTLNDPSPGLKTVVRTDTNEIVETIPMEAYEMQVEIEFPNVEDNN